MTARTVRATALRRYLVAVPRQRTLKGQVRRGEHVLELRFVLKSAELDER